MTGCARSSRSGRRSAASTARPTKQLWRRFSKARDTFNRRRGSHFADLDRQRARPRGRTRRSWSTKPSSSPTPTTGAPTAARFRQLMADWKAAGRAPKDADDALWQRFRAAQDTFFARRSASLTSATLSSPRTPSARSSCSPRPRRSTQRTPRRRVPRCTGRPGAVGRDRQGAARTGTRARGQLRASRNSALGRRRAVAPNRSRRPRHGPLSSANGSSSSRPRLPRHAPQATPDAPSRPSTRPPSGASGWPPPSRQWPAAEHRERVSGPGPGGTASHWMAMHHHGEHPASTEADGRVPTAEVLPRPDGPANRQRGEPAHPARMTHASRPPAGDQRESRTQHPEADGEPARTAAAARSTAGRVALPSSTSQPVRARPSMAAPRPSSNTSTATATTTRASAEIDRRTACAPPHRSRPQAAERGRFLVSLAPRRPAAGDSLDRALVRGRSVVGHAEARQPEAGPASCLGRVPGLGASPGPGAPVAPARAPSATRWWGAP